MVPWLLSGVERWSLRSSLQKVFSILQRKWCVSVCVHANELGRGRGFWKASAHHDGLLGKGLGSSRVWNLYPERQGMETGSICFSSAKQEMLPALEWPRSMQ